MNVVKGIAVINPPAAALSFRIMVAAPKERALMYTAVRQPSTFDIDGLLGRSRKIVGKAIHAKGSALGLT